MKTIFPIEKFRELETPFYYYDLDLLSATLKEINRCVSGHPFVVHYAIKANSNPRLLSEIREAGLGIDCVSKGELKVAMDCGFSPRSIVFAGVAKTDSEILAGIDAGIRCFNVESREELHIIDQLAASRGKIADVAIRVNPNIDAHTHKYITTGLNENKFGVDMEMLDSVISDALSLPNVELIGLHFHIGSQITTMDAYQILCSRINDLQEHVAQLGAKIEIINVGGGLGIDYDNPDNSIPPFEEYFNTFSQLLRLRPGQEVHFELGRSVVGQCGSLISRVIFVKEGVKKRFVMLDAGMTELIRPALYQAHHVIQNLTPQSGDTAVYDVVGPICESSDCFGEDELLPVSHRGDFFALRSAGAYGEAMASQYNCRCLPSSYFSE